MIGLIQLVKYAQVDVAEKCIAKIEKGILALIGIEKMDDEKEAEKLLDRILNYRIFPDADNKMNLSLKNTDGGLLLVPQFTLVAETNKGTRPGFSKGMGPTEGKILFEYLVSYAKKSYRHVESGQFGAYMHVSLCNDGPITFIIKNK